MLHLPMTLKQRYPKSLVNHTYHKRNPLLIQENPPAFKNLPQNSIWLSLEGERDRQYSDNIANAITYPKIQQDSAWRGKEIGNILWHLPLHRIFILSIYLYHRPNIVDVYDWFKEYCSRLYNFCSCPCFIFSTCIYICLYGSLIIFREW